MKNNFVSVASFLFLIIGIVHTFRLFGGWEVQISNLMVPMWISWIVVLLAFFSFLSRVPNVKKLKYYDF